ncbi:hypothetical protein IT408_01955 [Candidatus Uhrbacteria bacterium]|nr:hypothetical protein [Candidatus Uhrbacteria bacterium]
MTLEAWKFSAKLAWQDRYLRIVGISTLLVFLGWTSFFAWRLIPEGIRSGVLVMHYNIYLGIDDVRPWPWVFVSPFAYVGLYLLDLVIAAGIYRSDTIAARTIVTIGTVTGILWGISSFFLILVNL